MNPAITISLGQHYDRKVIWIKFDYNTQLQSRLKTKFPMARWSRTKKQWWIPDNATHRQMLSLPQANHLEACCRRIHTANHPILKRYVETLELKAYSPNTIRTYTNEVVALLQAIGSYKVEDLTQEQLRSYFLYCINKLKLSENLIHSRLNAVKFLFEQVLKREKFFVEIPRPKKASSLPKVMGKADIKKMLEATTNIKHLLMLKLCYGMGLRVSELVTLKKTDIDITRMQVLVKAGKGKKDRYVNLPESVLTLLNTYYECYKPKVFVFEGQDGGAFAIRSAQGVFKTAMMNAGIHKRVGIHGLRHSYATHLLEAGTDVAYIQKLLRHNDNKKTLIYTQVSRQDLGKI